MVGIIEIENPTLWQTLKAKLQGKEIQSGPAYLSKVILAVTNIDDFLPIQAVKTWKPQIFNGLVNLSVAAGSLVPFFSILPGTEARIIEITRGGGLVTVSPLILAQGAYEVTLIDEGVAGNPLNSGLIDVSLGEPDSEITLNFTADGASINIPYSYIILTRDPI